MTTGPPSSTPAPDSPAKRKPRTIILCFDGTANEYDETNTNVVKLYSVLRKDRKEDQVCYYQPGIGTYFAPGVVRPLFRWAAQKLDEAFAWYLSEHVLGGYRFLMQNYDVGDKVCIFGFSRGAYTARALAGMLYKVGLLSKDNVEQVPFAYRLYESGDGTLAQGFKQTFCRNVPIDFVGVWDTVASVGMVKARTLPFVEVNTTIRVFRHALSLDERRAKYRPNLYHHTLRGKSSETSDQYAIKSGTDEIFETDVEEVWFAGCHSDVGGGNSPDKAQYSLSNIQLRWMIEQIKHKECNILFDESAFSRWHIPRTIGQDKYSCPPNGDGVPGSEDGPKGDYDKQDAMQKITDKLWKNPLWWIIEFFPMSYTYQNTEGNWVTTWWPNFGRGRRLPPNPLFHTSVKIRMDELNYTPKAQYNERTKTYVS